MSEYLLFFIITLGVSTLFGIVGLGSSLVLIPLFTFLGLDFNFAKAMGLFVNGITTLSLSLQNLKDKILNIKDILVLLFISSVFAFLGAYGSNYISQNIVKILFVAFIFLSLLLLYLGNIKIQTQENNQNFFYIFVALIAFVGGLIGVGGGAVYLPLFLYLGIQTKQSIAMTSALIPVVSFSAFITYSSFVTIDWLLLADVTIAAFLGSFFAHKIMHKIKNDKYLKIMITALLLCIAIYMIYIEILGK